MQQITARGEGNGPHWLFQIFVPVEREREADPLIGPGQPQCLCLHWKQAGASWDLGCHVPRVVPFIRSGLGLAEAIEDCLFPQNSSGAFN